MRELLIGCGMARRKQLSLTSHPGWENVTTLDSVASHNPNVVHDLEVLPYPFADAEFDEIHAYDVLEHTGMQGDWRFFFAQWTEFHRILKPGGYFFGIVPHYASAWAWGDPSHTRVVSVEQLHFLSQKFYENVGKTNMSDFRHCWHGNFELVDHGLQEGRQVFVLRKAVH